MGDLVAVVSGDVLEVGDGSKKEGQLQMAECKGKSEIIQEGVNGVGCNGRIDCGPLPFKIGRKSRIEFSREEYFPESPRNE